MLGLYEKACDTSVNTSIMASGGNEITAAVSLINRGGDRWVITDLDTSALIPGRHYAICVDADGPKFSFSFGDTGYLVFIGALESVTPLSVTRVAAQEFTLERPFCNPDSDITEMYLDTECQTWHNFGAPLVASYGRNTGSAYLPGPAGCQTTACTKLTLDTTSLHLGGTYNLCMDIDGNNTKMTQGDSRFRIYVTPFTYVDPAVYPASAQTLTLTCPDGCSSDPLAYMATACDTSVKDGVVYAIAGIQSAPADFGYMDFGTVDAGRYNVTFDASALVVGKQYRFCVDVDGTATVIPFGDTILMVYVTPISAVSDPPVVYVSTILKFFA